MSQTDHPLRTVIFFSDTGGGHRSAAEALIEAWHAEHPGRVDPVMIDFFKHSPFPFNRLPDLYPWMVRHIPQMYAGTFWNTDSVGRARAVADGLGAVLMPTFTRLLQENPADVYVSVHPLCNHYIGRVRQALGLNAPAITVVTDLWTAHAFWFYPGATHIIVPTEGARMRALGYGVPAERLTVRGLPVARKFVSYFSAEHAHPRAAVRTQLGLPAAGRVVLVIGGGDGMGPVYEIARALDGVLAPPDQLVIITGRNAALRTRLESSAWRIPVHVAGFVKNMPEWMAAADVLVTKAGPGTIIEGLVAGLPLVLMGKVPGQEDGNVDYVVAEEVGVWQPDPEQAAAQVAAWFAPNNPTLATMAARARQAAHPHAASEIAADIVRLATTA